jgi:hypothetical protein
LPSIQQEVLVIVRAQPEIDLIAETDQVRHEFGLLESRILPLLVPLQQASIDDATSEGVPNTLTTWQRIIRELAAALPTREGLPGIPIDEVFLKEFLHQSADAGFSVRQGRIVWKITTFISLDLKDWHAKRLLEVMHDEPDDEPGASQRLLSQLDEFKEWLLAPAREVCSVTNEMCSMLPICVELDLDFVRRAFDLEARLARIRSDSSLGEEQRRRTLHEWTGYFPMHGFNNALLHVIASLANNHFDQIESFLGHPARAGGYTGLMPHYLVAVLHQKVRVLNELLREDSGQRP